MSLQALIEKMKNRCLKTHSKMPVFASDEILKLIECCEALYESWEGSVIDFHESPLAKHLDQICGDKP